MIRFQPSHLLSPVLRRFSAAIGWLLGAVLMVWFGQAAAVEDVWVPVTDTSLIVREGSALDFSAMVSAGPAGANGQLRISPQGFFEFKDSPGERQRFWSASVAFSPPNGGFPTHMFADLYAKQLRLHGYNMIRLHQVDAMLMVDRKADFDFDPVQLDRFQYFLAALKAQGIYWVMDILTSGNGAYGGDIPNRWADQHSLKSGIYFDPIRQQHWKQLATKLLTTLNPYTGFKLGEDPALAGVILVNENGLTFLAYLNSGRYPAGLAPEFAKWLRMQYETDPRLRAVWGKSLGDDETLTGNIHLPQSMKDRDARMRDFLRFVAELEIRTVDWMTKHVRYSGYGGPVTSLNNVAHLHADFSRARLSWIDMHAYLAEPSMYVSPGSEMLQVSSLTRRLSYYRELATVRQMGRPFTVTEYGQPFWNTWRREAGLAIGAYSRLQDWDMICQYGENTIELSMAPSRLARKNTIMPFGIGVDPIARASETLAGLLFQRGDVSTAKNKLVINVGEDRVFHAADSSDSITGDLSAMALLTGFEISFDKMAAARGASESTRPINLAQGAGGLSRHLLRLEKWIPGDPFGHVAKRVEKLRQDGVLSKRNRTDAGAGIFQSDTEEVLLDASNQSLSVITPKTVALSFGAVPIIGAGHMRVVSASVPAMVALSSIDGNTLQLSRRILGILATDAINTGMTFSDPDRKKLVSLGTLPARILAGSVVMELDTTAGPDLTLYALKLNGERAEILPTVRTATGIRFELNSIQPHGPTTFFELVAH